MKQLDEFLRKVETNTCIENMTLNLTPTSCVTKWGPIIRLSVRDLEKLAKALDSGNCKPGLIINFYSAFIGDKGMKALAEGLKSPNRPANLVLYLTGNKIGDEGLRSIIDALVGGPTTSGVYISLRGSYVDDSCFISLTGDNKITDTGAKYLAVGLEKMIVNNNCPENLVFDLSETEISSEGAGVIATALENAMARNQNPQIIYLTLPSHINPFLRERIEKDLEELRNRSQNVTSKFANNLFALKAKTANSTDPKSTAGLGMRV